LVWVTDLAGRQVALPADVKTVATLGSTPILNSAVEILGQGHKIANQPTLVHDIDGRWRMHKSFAPQLASAPFLRDRNHELIFENIIDLAPDLSITMTPGYLASLEKLDLPVVWVDWATSDLMLETVAFLGQVFNQTARAEAFAAYYRDRLRLASEIAANIPEADKKTVVFAFPQPYSVPEEPTETLLAKAGAKSLTAGLSKKGRWYYGPEDLLGWDPEYILVTDDSHSAALKADPRLGALRAVKANSFIKVPTVGHMWSGHTVEAPIVALWTIHRLYPNLYGRRELIDEMTAFYQTFFDYRMSPALAEEIVDGGW
jgi:iron complex transport system substrate-binding protein